MAESIQLYSAAGGHRWIQRLTAMLLSARHALQEAIRALGGVVPPEAITRAREVSRRRVAEQAQACTCRRCPVHRTQET